MPPAHFKDLALEAVDHQALADWWCTVLGYERIRPPEGEELPESWPVPLHDPAGHGPALWIVPVDEPRPAPGRMYLTVWAGARELMDLGATLVRAGDDRRPWSVLADPEGNEFCAFAPGHRGTGIPLGPR
ncbi:VOC family protein [Streptomyces sodiiphilus]